MTSVINLEVMQTIDDIEMGIHGVILLLTDCTGKEYSGAFLPRILDYLCNGDPNLIIPLILRKVGYWGMFSAKQIIEMRGLRTELLRFLSLDHQMYFKDFFNTEVTKTFRRSSSNSIDENSDLDETKSNQMRCSRPSLESIQEEDLNDKSLEPDDLKPMIKGSSNNEDRSLTEQNKTVCQDEESSIGDNKTYTYHPYIDETFDAFLEKDVYNYQYCGHPHGRGVSCRGYFK